eukprot:TRINITY_DN46349_c0_g1_i1.p1 TRINITY_DN46349_c0_g1~~TRINITY_DN46349_c0_g1_i1.p1  ORF type:complete len:328 (+),score=53.68 TRINITY_DN46349_c0_g1_i1:420-1403(+)
MSQRKFIVVLHGRLSNDNGKLLSRGHIHGEDFGGIRMFLNGGELTAISDSLILVISRSKQFECLRTVPKFRAHVMKQRKGDIPAFETFLDSEENFKTVGTILTERGNRDSLVLIQKVKIFMGCSDVDRQILSEEIAHQLMSQETLPVSYLAKEASLQKWKNGDVTVDLFVEVYYEVISDLARQYLQYQRSKTQHNYVTVDLFVEVYYEVISDLARQYLQYQRSKTQHNYVTSKLKTRAALSFDVDVDFDDDDARGFFNVPSSSKSASSATPVQVTEDLWLSDPTRKSNELIVVSKTPKREPEQKTEGTTAEPPSPYLSNLFGLSSKS